MYSSSVLIWHKIIVHSGFTCKPLKHKNRLLIAIMIFLLLLKYNHKSEDMESIYIFYFVFSKEYGLLSSPLTWSNIANVLDYCVANVF